MRRGQTALLTELQKAPLMIVRPFTLPCGTLMVFIVNPTGGVLGGDHSEIRVRVDSGARALLLTQSATRVQPSPDGRASTQDIHFAVAQGGRLEFYPERTLPFAGSAFRQTLRAELEAGAELGVTETLASGRVRSGERLAFASFESRTQVEVAGRRVFLDRQTLRPAEHTRAPGIWGEQDYAASGVFVGGGEVGSFPAVLGRLATGRTAGGAVWLRGAAPRGPELDAALHAAREALRSALFGAPPLQVRR
ncbi:urease accessory protein UreD [Deinococcus koreensis]|uniref:urease accessory protein UreD n=1 Tax=Deinococcus koreensis TaxID=2054903 RepID=UPI001FAF4ABC|nr:urease accessory protein UreD [Deinococcus koreensis]